MTVKDNFTSQKQPIEDSTCSENKEYTLFEDLKRNTPNKLNYSAVIVQLMRKSINEFSDD